VYPGVEYRLLRYVIAVAIGLHGLIYAIGFAATWRLVRFNSFSNTPTFPRGLGSASLLLMVLGVFWLVVVVAFAAAAVGLASRRSWWPFLAAGAAVLSLFLCLAWWNDAKAGVAINTLILIGLVATTKLPELVTPQLLKEAGKGSVSLGALAVISFTVLYLTNSSQPAVPLIAGGAVLWVVGFLLIARGNGLIGRLQPTERPDLSSNPGASETAPADPSKSPLRSIPDSGFDKLNRPLR